MRFSRTNVVKIILFFYVYWWGLGEDVRATTLTTPPTGPQTSETSPVSEPEFKQKTPNPSAKEQPLASEFSEQEFPGWTFEWPVEPVLEHGPHPKSLKSALLTITINPQQLDPGSDLIGNQNLSEQPRTLSAQAKITFEVEVPENYTQEEIIEMFTATAKHLPFFDQNFKDIADVQFEVTTPPPSSSSIAVVLAVVMMIIFLTASILVTYSRWYKKKHLSRIPVSLQSQTKTEQDLQNTRMALIGRMTSTVIHDVKNAFTAIQSCAEVMADEKLDPLERKDFAQLIVSEIERGVDMTQELMEFVRGQVRTLHVRSYPANALVQDTLGVLKRNFDTSSISIHTDLRYSGEIQVDVEKMRRVFMNILTNARDAMRDGGTVTITSRQVDANVQFEIIDTGCGMSPEVQARIFEPLFTDGKSNGTGLGMMIVKEILDAHQARIEVESDPGQGTLIRIVVPIRSSPKYPLPGSV